MNDTIRSRVEATTIRFPRGGRGVLVPGQVIVTAAHVVGRRWRSKRDSYYDPVLGALFNAIRWP